MRLDRPRLTNLELEELYTMEAWLSRDYYSNAGVTYHIRSWDRVKEVIPCMIC